MTLGEHMAALRQAWSALVDAYGFGRLIGKLERLDVAQLAALMWIAVVAMLLALLYGGGCL